MTGTNRAVWLGLVLLVRLAAPASAATYLVTNTSDSGPGSLREAIAQSNASVGIADRIEFNIPGSGVHTIAPQTELPAITDPVVIDGYSQPGASLNTLALGNDAVLKIEIDGSGVVGGGSGFRVLAGGSTLRGLVINRFPPSSSFSSGVLLQSSGNVVEGNYIGTDTTGTVALANVVGIIISSDGDNNLIGGSTPGSRNLISGHTISGIGMGGTPVPTSNRVEGNYIGTDKTGTARLPNLSWGIDLSEGNGNTIGGTTAGAGNLISGNQSVGIAVGSVASSSANVILGNRIGTNASGTGPLGNGSHGIEVTFASNTQVGGTVAGAGNLVAYNGGAGVRVFAGSRQLILSNSIFSNAELGIDLGFPAGVTPNDLGDADTGPNDLQNFPQLTSAGAAAGNTTVEGALNSLPSTSFRLEFFSNSVCDVSGFGEGRSFLGSTMVATDASGNAPFTAVLPVAVGPRDYVSATATDSAGSTSEFSNCVSQPSSFFTLDPCRVLDTRNAPGAYGGPALLANSDRSFLLVGQCGIPASARAVAVNLTVTGPTNLGHLTAYPGGASLPPVSTLNYRPDQTRANNAVLALGETGDISVRCVQVGGEVHLIIDVTGYLE